MAHRTGLSIVLLLVILSFAGCNGNLHSSCIMPPETHDEGQRKIGVSLAAKLEGIGDDSKLETAFETAVKADFDKLSDNNEALLLFLRAIDCYLQHGKIGETIALRLVEVVMMRWGSAIGLQGTAGAHLSPYARAAIEKSPLSTKILHRLRGFGVE